MKKYTDGRLGFNEENGRYGLLVSDLWENDGFHCGESLQVLIDGKWFDTRMEMAADQEWYLSGTSYKGDLDGVKVRI